MVLDFDTPSFYPFALVYVFLTFFLAIVFFFYDFSHAYPYHLSCIHIYFSSIFISVSIGFLFAFERYAVLGGFFLHCHAIGIISCSNIGKHFYQILNCGLLCQLIRYFLGLITIRFTQAIDKRVACIHARTHTRTQIHSHLHKWEQNEHVHYVAQYGLGN